LGVVFALVLSALIIICVITILHKCLKDKRHDVKIKTKYFDIESKRQILRLPLNLTPLL